MIENWQPLTVQAFAELPSTWPCPPERGSILLARIHPNCNRPRDDEDVIARALVFVPDRGLCRMTIRWDSVGPFSDEGGDSYYDDSRQYYRDCLDAIMRLPVIDLLHPHLKQTSFSGHEAARMHSTHGL